MSGPRAVASAATLLAIALLSGCGGSADTANNPMPPPVASVSVAPMSALVDQGATIQFSASVAGTTNHDVTWSVQEGTGGGSISQTGLFTAPAAAAEVHVIAASVGDPSKSSIALVIVRAVMVSMPLTASVPRGRQRQFTALVAGTVFKDLVWTVEEGPAGGTITADGVYTAPKSGGPFHVTARSLADPSKAATATVELTEAGFRLLNSTAREPRISPTATLLRNGKVLIAGGSWCRSGLCNGFDPLASAELFDPVTETFTVTGPMSIARTGHTATLLNNGTVLITGGVNPALESDRTAEIYNPDTGTFTLVGDLATGRVWHAAASLKDGRVLISGGAQGNVNDFGLYPTQTAEIYDPLTQIFSPAGDMPKEAAFHTASVLLDGTVLVAGGEGNSCPGAGTGVATFDAVSNIFSPSPNLASPRARHTSTTLSDGRVLITGGVNPCDLADAPAAYATAVVFDPATASYSPEKFMHELRSGHSATLLSDGKVLLVGSMAELFDPATGSFALTGDPNVPRDGKRATRLSDGRVLFVGAGSAAEVYE